MCTDISQPQKKRLPNKLPEFFLLSLVIALLVTTGYFYYHYEKLTKSPIVAQLTTQEDMDKAPTIATVSVLKS